MYIGSKRRLVPVLGNLLDRSAARSALDLFTGTTRVAFEFKRRGTFVTSVADAFVLFGKKSGWVRVEVDRNVLRQRATSPESLLKKAQIFGAHFRLVQAGLDTASYQSNQVFEYGRRGSRSSTISLGGSMRPFLPFSGM